MKKIIINLFFCTILFSCNNAQNIMHLASDLPDVMYTTRFVPGTEDIPVIRGFEVIKNNASAFDSPAGSIVDISFVKFGNNKQDEILNFYDNTLNQLGWQKISTGKYKRESQNLTVKVFDQQRDTVLNFYIEPNT